jgi:hypothetical protein
MNWKGNPYLRTVLRRRRVERHLHKMCAIHEENTRMPKERGSRALVLPEKNSKSSLCPAMCKEGKGVRNFACQYYDSCLDRAAKAMWSGFTCKDCDCYSHKEDDA